LTITENNHKIL